jgi:hypothetical protein
MPDGVLHEACKILNIMYRTTLHVCFGNNVVWAFRFSDNMYFLNIENQFENFRKQTSKQTESQPQIFQGNFGRFLHDDPVMTIVLNNGLLRPWRPHHPPFETQNLWIYGCSFFWANTSVLLAGIALYSIRHGHACPECPCGLRLLQKQVWCPRCLERVCPENLLMLRLLLKI